MYLIELVYKKKISEIQLHCIKLKHTQEYIKHLRVVLIRIIFIKQITMLTFRILLCVYVYTHTRARGRAGFLFVYNM